MRLMTPTGRLASVGACLVPTTPSSKFARAKAARTSHAWSNEEFLCARTSDKSRLHDLRFRRSRHHGVCVRIRSRSRARPNLVGLGHADRGGGIRHAFEFGAPAVTATTLIHPVSASASDGTDGRESCR